ncbi:uncharacterized protein LOC117551982 isoform X2 [Gymnodraco acuticeps]|uniref:Uncharacterized protein LOC117551982 isoform X2 n=1 Tax=Gymnodraco acuticeps TaxID=8218 RepID=A0A6P8UZE1_GYMAC|nr:uncharacterized protein LOC117551982 isoform X2 [Gymnodraco acuticeps]
MLRHTKKMAIGCPICNSPFRALSKHLQRNHSVRNLVERRILLLLAKGRINIRLHPCIIAGCEYIGTRLDRHLYRGHVELSRQEIHVVLTKLKKKVATNELHELRLTNPTVAMITSWDVDTVGDDVLSQPPPLSPVIECDNPDCKERRMYANRMRAQVDIYAAEVKSLRCMLQQRINRSRQRMNQRADDMLGFDEDDGVNQERVFLRKRSRTKSTPNRLSKSKGPSCRKSPIASHTPVSSSIDTDASSSSPPIHSPWFSGRGRGNRMRDITFPRIMEKYLQGYRDHYEGIDPTVRLQENAVSKISRVKSFLSFMSHGFNRLSDWLFLRDLKRIRGWSRSLIKSSLQVKRDKMEGLPSHKDIMACLTAAKTRIPQLLDVMTSNPTNATRTLLYGYMTLNWSCIYGHRPGVYSNMTNAEVRKAETTGTAFGFLIHVSNHKTANVFGEAQLYLTIEEFGWMKRWLEIKGTLTGTNNRYFLCTAGKNPSRNLASLLRLAWTDVGLKGPINFTDLRTVHADNAKRFQDIGNRQRVSDFMCHNTATADTFYAKNPSLKDAADIRMLFTESLQAAAAAASGGSEDNLGYIDIHSDRDSSGEEHSPTPYQDSPDTETSDEDFNAWRAAKREQSMAEHSPSDTGEERVPASAPTSPDTDNVASDQLVNMQCFVVLSPLLLDE